MSCSCKRFRLVFERINFLRLNIPFVDAVNVSRKMSEVKSSIRKQHTLICTQYSWLGTCICRLTMFKLTGVYMNNPKTTSNLCKLEQLDPLSYTLLNFGTLTEVKNKIY